MQLLSMEVNQLGSADRTQVGMLAVGLNAVCGRRGSGKSSLLQWLRGIILPSPADHRQAPRDAQASGRLSLRIGDCEYQFERSERAGRTASKVLRQATNRWNGAHAKSDGNGSVEGPSKLQRQAFDRLASIASDSHSSLRLWDAARELQLDEITKPRYAEERATLVSREQELLHQLQPLEGLSSTREGLSARRRQIESDLDRLRRESVTRHYTPATDEHHRLSDRLTALDREAQKLRDEIGELDAALAHKCDAHTHGPAVLAVHDRSYRERLLSLDAQLARWRNTLAEIRAHRERLEAAATDAQLSGQLGEQFTPINQATPRLALRSLEAQIVEARRHFDKLLEGVDRYRADNHDDARQELPQTLRLMQRELHEVCQQLSRHESLTSNRAMQDQILQLSRCENEMRLAIERLIVERGELLRSIATACQLSVDQVAVAYSDSCRCTEHPQLDAWLTAISAGPSERLAAHSIAESSVAPLHFDHLAQLEKRRAQAQARLDDSQRDYRETEARLRRLGVLPLHSESSDRAEAELLRDLDQANEELLRLESRDRLRVELTDVRRRLQNLPLEGEDAGSLRGRYQRHLAALTSRPYARGSQSLADDTLRRDVSSREIAEVDRLEEIALRLAIVEVLAARRQPIPLTLDQTLDGLSGPQRLLAVRYLAGQADSLDLQIIALTDDEELVAAVKAVRGAVVPIVVSRAVEPVHVREEYDVNRQLLAYANDLETDKWNEPEWTPPTVARSEAKRRFVLTMRSEIDQLPSLTGATAGRLRAVGIEHVADLLDAEPSGLADNARLSGVTIETIQAWQNEARLLCAMPQLRAFDARVLAGAGIRDHRQLTDMHPGRLLERVERFLATERGRQILRSGNNYELSRITAWMASAKRDQRHDADDEEAAPAFGVEPEAGGDRARRTPVQRTSHRHDEAHESAPTYHIVEREDASEAAVDEGDGASQPLRRRPKGGRRDRTKRSAAANASNGHSARPRNSQASRWTFQLELSSPVIDAPSIGTSVAQSMSKVGVNNVEQLLSADADDLAHDLDQPRLTSAIIRAWQEQSRLVCRIPNLRGHDAQILVACGITTPEALLRVEPDSLLQQVNSFVNSSQGQRTLRNSPAPDLEEVKQWISWANHSRTLLAA